MKKEKWNIIGIVFSMFVALVTVCVSIRIWEIDINIPVGLYGDGVLATTLYKSIYENGWKGAYFCQSLGAPDIATLIDAPFLDNGMILIACILCKLLPNANAVIYIDYIITYVLAAFTMYLLLNRITNDIWVKMILSISFAITPYHFYRGMGHLTLSHYYVIPLAIYLSLIIYEEQFSAPYPERYQKEKWKIFLMYGCCIILGMSNVYYAFFGLLCMSVAWILKLIKTKKISCLYKEAILIYTLLLSVLVQLAPKIIYACKHGENTVAGIRGKWEVEIFALKLIQLLLPCSYNRIDFLADINATYSSVQYNINENAFASLGIVATIGFIIACCSVTYSVLDKRTNFTIENERINVLSFIILFLILYSVAGGFGAFVNYYITPEIRCLNRSSIVIVCISLCIVALFLKKICDCKRRKVYINSLLGIIFLFSMYSEIMISAPGWQIPMQNENLILKDFFAKVEKKAGKNGMIYELPYMDFPENGPINQMNDYEPALGYLYTDSLRWSYGGMRGRDTSAKELYIDEGMSERFLYRIKKAGFDGVYIDTKGFADGGTAILEFYADNLGVTPIVSGDNWLYYFDIKNVEIDKRMDDPYYVYAYKAAEKYEITKDSSEKQEFADELKKGSNEAAKMLYGWMNNKDDVLEKNDDEAFVIFLYNDLLNRQPSEQEVNDWTQKIKNGMNRQSVLKEFLSSVEFENIYLLNDK